MPSLLTARTSSSGKALGTPALRASTAAHTDSASGVPERQGATALVHEAYVRLVGNQEVRWQSRAHFFAAAAEAMRRILIDLAPAKKRVKRGGGRMPFDLATVDVTVDAVSDDILDLDEALEKLAAEDPVKAELVKLCFFGGMSMREAAEFVGISTTTADRYWTYARAFPYAQMRDNSEVEDS